MSIKLQSCRSRWTPRLIHRFNSLSKLRGKSHRLRVGKPLIRQINQNLFKQRRTRNRLTSSANQSQLWKRKIRLQRFSLRLVTSKTRSRQKLLVNLMRPKQLQRRRSKKNRRRRRKTKRSASDLLTALFINSLIKVATIRLARVAQAQALHGVSLKAGLLA